MKIQVSTKPEYEKEESVSELRQIVRGISEVLKMLEDSNIRIVKQLGLNSPHTSTKTQTTENV